MILDNFKKKKRRGKSDGFWGRTRNVGAMVVFTGPDGCGKTTLIEGVVRQIKLENPSLMIVRCHLRPGFLPSLATLAHPLRWASKRLTSQVSDPHGAPPSGMFFSFFRLLYYTLDYFGVYILKSGTRKTAGKKIVLFDRYFYDLVVDPLRARLQLPAGLLMGFAKLVPKPDLVLYLDAPAEILWKRKPELTVEELNVQRLRFRSLINQLKNGEALDATRPEEEVLAQTLEYIKAVLRIKDSNSNNLTVKSSQPPDQVV